MIRWVGKSDIWTPDEPVEPRYAMPLVEEEVLHVAFSDEYRDLIRLSQAAAIRCTSRLAQRVALAHTGLNPAWSPVPLPSGVLKRAASCHNNGVLFLRDTEHTELLEAYAPELCGWGVHEEFLSGDAYEVDGFVLNGRISYFHTLKQNWNADWTRILSYQRTTVTGLLYAAETAIRAAGLDNCPFCIEFRNHKSQWKVIEIHARLGEDKGLTEQMSNAYPLDVINRAAARISSK